VEFSRVTKIIVFADDLIVLSKGVPNVEAEIYMKWELTKNSVWAQKNKLKFNENK